MLDELVFKKNPMSTLLPKDNNTLFFEVLSILRRLTNEISSDAIKKEAEMKALYDFYEEFLLLRPEDSVEKHKSTLAKFLLYENPYRKLHMYLQGVDFSDDIVIEPNKNESFLEIQKNVLMLQMGLFAYADASSSILRYLYGPQNLPEDRKKSLPHFYIKPFYCEEKKECPGDYEFKALDVNSFWEHSRTFYYGRRETNYIGLDFVQILQSTKGCTNWDRRTKFEHDLNIIYASSGEMDACILSWLFLCVDKNKANTLESALSTNSNTNTINDLEKILFQIKLDAHAVEGYHSPSDEELKKLKPWGSDQKPENLFYWLHRLRLIKEKSGPQMINITERGHRLIRWLNLYLRSLKGEKLNILGKPEPTFYRLIKGVSKISVADIEEDKWHEFMNELQTQGKRNEKSPLSGLYILFEERLQTQILEFLKSETRKPADELKYKIIEELNRILENNIDIFEKYIEVFKFSDNTSILLKQIFEPYCRSRLFLEAKYPKYFKEMSKSSPDFPSWLDGIDKNIITLFINRVNNKKQCDINDLLQVVHIFLKWRESHDDDKKFTGRCRFNLLGHLTLRASWENPQIIETASRAWIVFPVNFDYIETNSKRSLTSVGFFLGTFKDSTSDGQGSLENFHKKKVASHLIEQISRIQQVTHILATVENREIYMKEIYNIHMQDAIEKQHKWTIHEIRNSILKIKEYVLKFTEEDFERNSHDIYMAYDVFKKNYAEFEMILQWVDKLMKSEVCEGDIKWVNSNQLYHEAFSPYVERILNSEEIIRVNENFLEDNHANVLGSLNLHEEIEIPFFTYKNLLHELSKNILKYADRGKKCVFNFTLSENFLIIEIKNIYKKNKTHMISTGKGLEVFDRFLKVYNSNSEIDRSGLINKEVGDECICKVKIAIRRRR